MGKQRGNPKVQVRIPRPLLANVRLFAEMYKAPVHVFLRDMIAATCGGQLEVTGEFQKRLGRGIDEKRQLELNMGNGVVLGRPGETHKAGYRAVKGRPTGGEP